MLKRLSPSFQCLPAVAGGAKGGAPQDTSAVSQLTSLARNVVATSAMQDATSAAYWAYHMGRTAFFVGEVRNDAVLCS